MVNKLVASHSQYGVHNSVLCHHGAVRFNKNNHDLGDRKDGSNPFTRYPASLALSLRCAAVQLRNLTAPPIVTALDGCRVDLNKPKCASGGQWPESVHAPKSLAVCWSTMRSNERTQDLHVYDPMVSQLGRSSHGIAYGR